MRTTIILIRDGDAGYTIHGEGLIGCEVVGGS